MNGCMQMNNTYGEGGAEMTDTWTCFGDPSVIVRTQAPETMTVSYDPVISVGSTSFDVSCSTENALVSLTLDGEILGTAFVSGGVATVNFEPISVVSDLTVTVTAFNTVPDIATVSVVVVEILGCMDSSAYNYHLEANVDDGSCEYGTAVFEQVIDMPLGWSFFSTYMLAEDMDVAFILSEIDPEIIIVKTNAGLAYLPDWAYNGIGNMEPGAGYQIKLLNAATLIVEGIYMLPEENPITLTEGWNMFGYLPLGASDVALVFTDVVDQVIIVKNGEGSTYLPQYDFNGIGNMEPGQGYQVKMLSTQVLFYLPND